MSKLLTEPRVPNEITTPKNKVRKKKVSEEDRPEVKYTLLYEGKKDAVNELFRIYKENPFNARVKFFNDKNRISFTRQVIFERGNDFEICEFRNSFGISISNRMYSSQKKIQSIIYKSGKFYYKSNEGKTKKFVPLTYYHIQYFGNGNVFGCGTTTLADFFKQRFFWFEAIQEFENAHHLNFNVIKSKKLFGNKVLCQHLYGVPYRIYKLLIENKVIEKFNNYGPPIKVWKSSLPYLINVDKASVEILKSNYFYDTIQMAKTLDRKVNCLWGVKRLKEEHDTWAREIGNIVLDCAEEYDLKIRKEFIDFAEFSKYKLFLTNKDLLLEGMMKNHCVGTYISRVNNGECAIYSVENYTLQIMIGDFLVERPNDRVSTFSKLHSGMETFKKLYIAQFKGKHNCSVPDDVFEGVLKMLDDFNLVKPITELEEFKPLVKAKQVDDDWLM